MNLAWLLIIVSIADIAEPLWRPEDQKLTNGRRVLYWLIAILAIAAAIVIATTGSGMPMGVAVYIVVSTSAWVALRRVPKVPRPLAVLALVLSVILAAITTSMNWRPRGWLVDTFELSGQELLIELGFERTLVWLAALAFLTASSNAIVRSVLEAADSRILRSSQTLKGGRIIGSIERLFILGMAMMGEFTAVGAVIAAKGLLRFPEVSQSLRAAVPADESVIYESSPDHPASKTEPETPGHIQAEYVLLGSFVSWAVALAVTPLVYVFTDS